MAGVPNYREKLAPEAASDKEFVRCRTKPGRRELSSRTRQEQEEVKGELNVQQEL
jgi:hypothetical protein